MFSMTASICTMSFWSVLGVAILCGQALGINDMGSPILDSIVIETKNVNVNIINAGDNDVSYSWGLRNKKNLISEIDNGKLTVKCLAEKTSTILEKNPYVYVYVNSNNTLHDCKIKMESGNLYIPSDVNLGEGLKIDCGAGNVEIGCDLSNSTLNMASGNLELSGKLSGQNNISLASGNAMIDVSKNEKRESDNIDYNIKTNIGSISVNKVPLDEEGSKSNLVTSNSCDTKLNVNVGVGDINIKSKKLLVKSKT